MHDEDVVHREDQFQHIPCGPDHASFRPQAKPHLHAKDHGHQEPEEEEDNMRACSLWQVLEDGDIHSDDHNKDEGQEVPINRRRRVEERVDVCRQVLTAGHVTVRSQLACVHDRSPSFGLVRGHLVSSCRLGPSLATAQVSPEAIALARQPARCIPPRLPFRPHQVHLPADKVGHRRLLIVLLVLIHVKAPTLPVVRQEELWLKVRACQRLKLEVCPSPRLRKVGHCPHQCAQQCSCGQAPVHGGEWRSVD
mmetsp:Transcript_86022/g.200010  ORF Transcript_86022/g.200010 Transcript_86022/m.200010 type:complete len:251 (-) Transcript_86022:108-860(-)